MPETAKTATAAYCSTHGWWQASTGCAECVALAAEFAPWAEVSREIAERTFEAGAETWPSE